MPLFTIANMTTVIIVSYSSRTNTAAAISPPYTSSTSIKPYQNYYYNKYHEGILEIAKGFLNILLNQLVNKTMVAAVKGK